MLEDKASSLFRTSHIPPLASEWLKLVPKERFYVIRGIEVEDSDGGPRLVCRCGLDENALEAIHSWRGRLKR